MKMMVSQSQGKDTKLLGPQRDRKFVGGLFCDSLVRMKQRNEGQRFLDWVTIAVMDQCSGHYNGDEVLVNPID